MKSSKARKKNMSLSGVISSDKKTYADEGDSDDDEFDYTPLHVNGEKSEENSSKESEKEASKIAKEDTTNSSTGNSNNNESDPVKSNDNGSTEDENHNDQKDISTPSLPQPPLPFKNDGSFLEMMKKMQNSNSDGN